MFKPVSAKVDFVKLEKKWLRQWQQSGLLKKYLHKNDKAKKRFSFFDGPITANNPMGVHHAWGRTYKDVWQRYKNMKGFKQRFQNGFDCQGLWVEVEVEKDLGFNSRRDIEKYGLANFSIACKKRVEKFSEVQIEQSKRLGQFMDWDNSYYTYTDKNIEYIWSFLKKCREKGWLYKGFRSLPWCARCGTSLSQHELSDSYKEMTHRSVYLKFPIKGEKNMSFLVWTTTPWTLAANVALAVHPVYTYVKVKVGNEYLILVEDLLRVLEGDYQVIEKIKGAELKNLRYSSPFEELSVQKDSEKVVLPWKEVSNKEGTGIVHIAPGCGEEDFELGKKHKLKVIVPINEDGNYVEGFGALTGKFAHQVENLVFDSLKRKNLLYKIEDYTHRYPVCWRCKEPIVFRAEENWFISAKEIRPKMIREVKKVKWHPEYVGKLMEDWLKNMGDWNISRKRYFGLPLPFYECSCGRLIIIGSKRELKKLAVNSRRVDELPELHRPWIDEVKVECPSCDKKISRITDIGDCWLDAGIVPFSTIKYLEDKKYWQKWFPAHWISEMREQVRLWFYSMLFMSVTFEDKAPYLEVLSYEKLFDEKGKAMHKSDGNAIWFDEAAEKIGVDVMRWMYCKQSPEANLLFGYNVAHETRRQFHLLLWNIYKFFVSNANVDGWRPKKSLPSKLTQLDEWILTRLSETIAKTTEALEDYNAGTAVVEIEKLVNDFSTWYIRRSRGRVGPAAEDKKDKNLAYSTLYTVLVTLTKILAPFVPYLSEEIYKNLTNEESVHLQDWPKAGRVNHKLLADMELVRKICELGNAARKEAGIKVRQPLNKLKVNPPAGGEKLKVGADLIALIKDELNVRKVSFKVTRPQSDKDIKDIKVELDTKITPDLKTEGEARELIRQIQALRKKAGCRLDQKIKVYGKNFPANQALRKKIKRKTLARELLSGNKLKIKY